MNPRHRRRQLQTGIQKDQGNKADSSLSLQGKKIQLIERLHILVESIGSGKSIGDDRVIIELQKIQDEANIHDLKQIGRLAHLAIGKRILNIELEKKRAEIQNKIDKKREMEEYFRENKIKKTQYETIALNKLKENTFIAKPYPDGKGFIESTILYEKVVGFLTGKTYEQQLKECKYIETIKNINKIFFQNFSMNRINRQRVQKNPVFKLVLFLLVLIIICSAGICFSKENKEKYAYGLFVIDLLAIFILTGLALWSFLHVNSMKNQLEETMKQVREEFDKINLINASNGKNFQWSFHPELLYLQVKFKSLNQSQDSRSISPISSFKVIN